MTQGHDHLTALEREMLAALRAMLLAATVKLDELPQDGRRPTRRGAMEMARSAIFMAEEPLGVRELRRAKGTGR